MHSKLLGMFASLLVLILAATALFAGQSKGKADTGKTLYTAYNLWYEQNKEDALWCINYKTGNMIPAGTEVTDVRITTAVKGRFQGGEIQAISFVTIKDGQQYYVNFNAGFHPGKTIKDYVEMMFTEKTFDELIANFTAVEIDAIREGKLKVGMSKDAVLVSYGYPPEHKTPNLENDVWYYWINRFRTKAIHFDEDGKTVKAPQKDPDEL
jgi:hypothetical protein